jgi:peptidoglycan/LPS O-acetylase OafA/YrhL
LSGKKNRLGELDALRGFAVIAVILYHYTSRYNNLIGHLKEGYLNLEFGYLGVQLFFIISGFVIFMTVERCNNIFDFAFRRATRLYPAYIAGVILTYLTVSMYRLEGRTVSLTDAALNLTMLQGLIPGLVPYVDGAYWSLTTELIFYTIMGFFLVSGFIKKLEVPLFGWLTLAFIVRLVGNNLDHFVLTALRFYGILEYSNFFIAGIMFYKLKSENKGIYHVIISFCLITEFVFNGLVVGIVVASFFGLFYLLLLGKLSFLNNRYFLFFGTISYALYLVHQNIGYVIINFLEARGYTSEIYLLVPLGISIILASIITFYIEKPLQKVLRNQKNIKLAKPSFLKRTV